MRIFDKAGKKFSEVQKKTGDVIAVYKLQSQIKRIEEDIQRVFASIGEICYKSHLAGHTPENLETLYNNIDRMHAEIHELTAEIDKLNKVARCPECGGAVDKTGNFCPHCGCRLPEKPVCKAETCPNCGNVRSTGDRFCDKCGHSYSESSDNTACTEQ